MSFYKSKRSFRSDVKWPSCKCVTKIAIYRLCLRIVFFAWTKAERDHFRHTPITLRIYNRFEWSFRLMKAKWVHLRLSNFHKDVKRRYYLCSVAHHALLARVTHSTWYLHPSPNVLYEGVSNSCRNHPKVKEPEMSFLYSIHKTSLKSHFAKLHILPNFYSLSTDQNCYMGAWHWNSYWDVHFKKLTSYHKCT